MSMKIHLDELIGICDEMSALIKAGLPLNTELLSHSQHDTGDHLRQIIQETENGSSLSDAIGRNAVFPPFYSVVIEAGLASGNLPGVLNIVSKQATLLRDVRLFLLQTTLYPMFLFTTLWTIFVGLLVILYPKYLDFFDKFTEKNTSMIFVEKVEKYLNHDYHALLLLVIPIAILWLVYFIWCHISRQSDLLGSKGHVLCYYGIPWLGTAILEMQKSVFASNLALLLESAVPLDRATELAEGSSGYDKKRYIRLLQWVRNVKGPHLFLGLRFISDDAQIRAKQAIIRCETFLPAFITFFIAVNLVAAYCLIILWPYLQLFYYLSKFTQ